MARWNREQPTENDKKRLRQVVNDTPGLTMYGNRARIAVCVPVDVAEALAAVIAERGQSAGTVCAQLLKKALKEKAIS